MTLRWHGDRVYDRVMKAAGDEATATVDEALDITARETPVLTGKARDSLHREGDPLDLRWGYGADVDYAIFIEIGANGRPGVHALRRGFDAVRRGHIGRIARRLAL